MRLFQDLSIKRKLTAIIMVISTAALLLSCIAFITYDLLMLRQTMKRDLSVLAGIIGSNSTAALAFDDQNAARETLSALSAEPHVVSACVYSKNGKPFAKYLRENPKGDFLPPPPRADGSQFEANHLVHFQRIMLDGELLGTVYIQSDLKEMEARLWRYSLILLIIVCGSSLVAYLLTARLQSVISLPILHLAQTAKGVTNQKDYSIRAVKESEDEIGTLIESFNGMLEQIQIRDEELQRHREHLREEVLARTKELQQTNEQLIAAKEKAEEASRAKSEFLANMSHELRTPLNAIIGYSEMLQEIATDETQEEFTPDLKKIQSAGKHLLGLINDILDLSKIEAGKMQLYVERFKVRPVIDEVTNTLQPLIEKNNNRLELDCDKDLGEIAADQTKTRQILFNLLSNACKFTKEGKIRLEARRRKGEDGEWMQFQVQDTGIGMSLEEIAKLFKPFTQADPSTTRKYGGTGLGLAISRRFCQMMGGDLRVESQPGRGSTFTLELPTQATTGIDGRPAKAKPGVGLWMTSSDKPEQDNEPREMSLGAPQVLVIDDDPSVQELVRRLLAKEGIKALEALDGEEGLRLAREKHPMAIILDVIMPAMDGWTVLAALKEDKELAEIPVVVQTIVDDRNKGFSLGASDYLVKPIKPEQLTTVLHRWRGECRHGDVLLVEDDPMTREMMRRILERTGWFVREAENGRVALEQVAQQTPELILLDLVMPEMDGLEFLRHLRSQEVGRTIPVVVVTGRELSDEERQQLNGSVEKILGKGDQDGEQLLGEVCSLVRNRPGTRSPAEAQPV
ncbi:MAG TPA: response regulator [Terriglobia bacterium]|nr:response regulator [Terriglobia bacterium]